MQQFFFLLKEDGGRILKEDGDDIVLDFLNFQTDANIGTFTLSGYGSELIGGFGCQAEHGVIAFNGNTVLFGHRGLSTFSTGSSSGSNVYSSTSAK